MKINYNCTISEMLAIVRDVMANRNGVTADDISISFNGLVTKFSSKERDSIISTINTYLEENQKMNAIKLVRDTFGISLSESKEFVENPTAMSQFLQCGFIEVHALNDTVDKVKE